MKTIKKLEEIFQDILDDEAIRLTPQMWQEDIEDWDSLSNIQIVIASEKEFGIKFTLAELAQMHSIGELIEKIESKHESRS